MKTANIKAAVLSATLLGLVLPGMAEEEKRTAESPRAELGNELVDVRKFRISTDLALKDRARKRITESQFIEMSKDEQTMILDTRSAASFALLHVRGAVHLNFSEMTTGSLAEKIPSKKTRILIYCNNNFQNEPREGRPAFPAKSPGMALNIPTYITLHAYGYETVHELGPLLDVRSTRIPLAGDKISPAPVPFATAKL